MDTKDTSEMESVEPVLRLNVGGRKAFTKSDTFIIILGLLV